MSDTPETDNNAYECIQRFEMGGSTTAEKQSCKQGDCVFADFARKLERERDEARKERNAALSDRDAWARLCGAVDCYTPSTAEPYAALKLQRDALREEVERAEAKCSAEYEAHKMTQAERDALRAEAEQLKSERENWRVSSVCRELRAEVERLRDADSFSRKELRRGNEIIDALRAEVERLKSACEKEFASVQQLNDEVEQLKSDKSRLDWLEKRESMEGFTRDAIDVAMKGEL